MALDPKNARLAVAGNGLLALRRLKLLRAAGASAVSFSDAPVAALAAEAGLRRLPSDDDLAGLHALWIVDLNEDAAVALVARARALRVLVNVEDRPELCDFHSVAEVRRGDLLLTISTGGAAPGLAASLRRHLEACFPAAWAERVREVAALRAGWRRGGLGMAEIGRRIDAHLAARCWLTCPALDRAKPV